MLRKRQIKRDILGVETLSDKGTARELAKDWRRSFKVAYPGVRVGVAPRDVRAFGVRATVYVVVAYRIIPH